MAREYGEFDDVPIEENGQFTDIDRAKVIIARYFARDVAIFQYKDKIIEKYGITDEGDRLALGDWYQYYGLINSYKQNDIHIWTRFHRQWPGMNRARLIQNNPGAVRRIYRRLGVLSSCERLDPVSRTKCTAEPYIVGTLV